MIECTGVKLIFFHFFFFIECTDYEQGKCPDLSITDVKNEADNLFKQATGFDEKLSSSSTLVRLNDSS